MTYTVGNLIEATDYNGFVSTTSNANVNDIWSTGSGNKGYGQTALATVSAAAAVTATQWANLVNTISTIATHQGTTITSRTAPTAGNLIQILANINTDLTTLTTKRGDCATSGSQYTAWTGTTARTAATGSGTTPWTITFTHTVTFPSANAARYFFNAGGRILLQTSKTSTGTDADDEWNDLATTLCGAINITAGGGLTQVISGSTYTGTTKVGGTGTPDTLLTTTGWYDLLTTDTIIYKQFADTSPYTTQYIQVKAKTAGTGTQLVITTEWFDPGGSAVGSSDNISGGTDTVGATFGTAPATLVTYYPPGTGSLTASWGVPTVAATVAVS